MRRRIEILFVCLVVCSGCLALGFLVAGGLIRLSGATHLFLPGLAGALASSFALVRFCAIVTRED